MERPYCPCGHLHSPDSVTGEVRPCPPHRQHYGKPAICRVPESLPSVFYRALGKDRVCRVPNKIHSANKNTRQNTSLPSVFFSGTRQRCILPSAIFWHTAKYVFAECFFLALGKDVFCRVPLFWHSANRLFAVCIFFALGKSVFRSNF